MDGSEFLIQIPPNWELVPLIALGKWAIGSGFPQSEQGHQDGPYFFLKVSDMNLQGNEKYIVSSQNTIDASAAERMGARIHPPNTIIFPKIGGAIATNKRRILTRSSAIDNNCLGITFWEELSIDWCYLLLRTLDFALYQAGTAVPALQQRVLEQIPVGLPPVAEQRRIVAKVDELMALYDRLEAAQREREIRRDRLAAASHYHLNNGADAEAFRKHAHFYLGHLPRLTTRPDQIKQLRQTILNLAVRGQLVPQDPSDEPASELLKHIQAEKARLVRVGEAKEQKRLQENRSAGKPFDIPQTWLWVSLGDVAFGFRYGTSVKCSYEPTGEPVLRIPNIDNGRINVEDLKFGPLARREADDLRLHLGDILMVRSNGSLNLVGRAALVEANAVGYCYAGYLVRVRTSVIYLDTHYLLLALTSAHVRNQIEIPIRTTVGLKNVNATELGSLTIPLPPLAEQHRIVAKVDELMAVCDRLEAQLTAVRTDASQLLEAVLHNALSPQDERLQALRAT